MKSTDDPDDDSQQSPGFVDARPRADSSKVDKMYVGDLEPASLREIERGKLQGQAAEETVLDALEARMW